MVPHVRIDHVCSKTTIDYWQHNHYSLVFRIEISLLFQQNMEYWFVFTFPLSISNPDLSLLKLWKVRCFNVSFHVMNPFRLLKKQAFDFIPVLICASLASLKHWRSGSQMILSAMGTQLYRATTLARPDLLLPCCWSNLELTFLTHISWK